MNNHNLVTRSGAVLTGLLLVLLGGCGNGTTSARGGPAADDRRAQQAGDDLVARIWGTAEQKDAGQFLSNYWLNVPVEACMAEAGFEFPLPGRSAWPRPWVAYVPDGGSGTTWLAALGSHQVSEELLAVARSGAREQRAAVQIESGETSDAEYDAALSGCEDTRRFEESQPPGADELSGEYTRVVEAVDSELGTPADYLECMAESGYALSDFDGSGFGALYGYLREAAPPSDQVPARGETGSDAWGDFVQLESDALTADSDCRRERYEKGWEQLTQVLEQFQTDHAKDLGSVQRGWERIAQQAQGLGFAPQ